MRCASAWKRCVRRAEPLAPYTNFRIGGPADLLARPRDAAQLADVVRAAADAELPLRVLGAGNNVLVSDAGVRGMIVQLTSNAFRRVSIDGNRVRAAAGANLPRLVHHCCRVGLGGLVGLAGVPATLGGALRMNAGTQHGEIGRFVTWLDVLEPDGSRRRLSRAAAAFRYRQSGLDRRIVLECELELPIGDADELLRTMRAIKRAKAAHQPLAARCAGCIFKNPPGDAAGRLIDAAGFKGRVRGGAQVSERHANFIVNRGGATSRDVVALAEDIRRAVFERQGIVLEYEIQIWERAA